MIINFKEKILSFKEGEEVRQYLPILIGVLRTNNNNKPVRMTRRDGYLTVTCYSMTDGEWNSSVNDIKAWHNLLNIWKEATA